ncbi:DUF1134 domain-containing protein [Sphingomonas sp. DG1-23]|uniref:DUF1134 domain-containing protein n=1 Tax=Sphingomonas sp. DG1-23 TaxID=3068316 RepID=UPI00273F46A3|nr:DUF1134 domain-containing protein [Sphingomonas sp. DG1-23]MDP5280015.1 DUF1134 domain-containing protein [Sphingomonas sp. DG1-23]
MRVRTLMLWAAAASLGLGAVPASAQITTIDPNTAIDSDLQTPPPPQNDPQPVDQGAYQEVPRNDAPVVDPQPVAPATEPDAATSARAEAANTYARDDLLSAAEGVFGKGASGLAGIIEDILKDQGQPNAYIAGREAGGAIGVGLRYGSGELFHKIEGQRKVYWTGPSIGFDVGGDANKVFVLVYNLYDSQELYKRFPAGEGRVYFVGGFSASYMRRGDVVLIPVRLGVGWRLGVNAGYMKFSEKQRWLPF